MARLTKRERLIEDLKERYERLGTYRAVKAELGHLVSTARIQQVIEYGDYSPKIARIVGIEETDIRWSPRCSRKVRSDIRKQCELLEITNDEMLELMWDAWWYQEFAEHYYFPIEEE